MGRFAESDRVAENTSVAGPALRENTRFQQFVNMRQLLRTIIRLWTLPVLLLPVLAGCAARIENRATDVRLVIASGGSEESGQSPFTPASNPGTGKDPI